MGMLWVLLFQKKKKVQKVIPEENRPRVGLRPLTVQSN